MLDSACICRRTQSAAMSPGIKPARKAEHHAEVRACQLVVHFGQVTEDAHDFEHKVVREDLLKLA